MGARKCPLYRLSCIQNKQYLVISDILPVFYLGRNDILFPEFFSSTQQLLCQRKMFGLLFYVMTNFFCHNSTPNSSFFRTLVRLYSAYLGFLICMYFLVCKYVRNLSKMTCFVCMRVEVMNTFWHPFIDPSILGQNWVVGNLYTGGQNNYSCVHTSYDAYTYLPL